MLHFFQPLSKPAVYHAAVQTHTLQYLSVATQTQDSDLPCDYGTVGPSPGMRTSERELGDMQTRLVLLKQEVLRKDDTIKQMDSLIKQGESVRRCVLGPAPSFACKDRSEQVHVTSH